jgi:O-antigen/teichoic acid export membrane protein
VISLSNRHRPETPGPARTSGENPAQVGRAASRADVIFSVAARVIGKAAALVLIVGVARLGDDQLFVGYSYLVGLAVLLGAITEIGVSVIASRDVARGDISVSEAYGAALPVVVVVSLAAAIGFWFAGALDQAPGSSGLPLAIGALYIAIAGTTGLQSALLRGDGRLRAEAGLQFVTSVGLVLAVLAILVIHPSLMLMMSVIALREVGIAMAFRRLLPRPRWHEGSVQAAWGMVRNGLWMGAASSCGLA